jgi:hypothetical protein
LFFLANIVFTLKSKDAEIQRGSLYLCVCFVIGNWYSVSVFSYFV